MLRTLALSLWLFPALLPARALAQPLTFDQALALGEASPSVEAPRRELAAREAGDDGIGGTAQSTTINVMPGAVLVPDQERGFDLQLSVTQGWNLADLGGARRHAADREREALGAQVRADALRARLEAARRWIDVATLQSVEALLEARRAVAARRLERAERALALGAGRAADVAAAHAALAEIDQRRLDVEGARFTATNQLAVATGRSRSADLRAEGPLPAPQLPSERAVRARIADLDAMPEVAVRRLTASAARAREAEASAQYAPVLSLGAQVERSSTDSWVLYGIAQLSFEAFGQERRSVSAAQAASAREEAELDVARVRARADLEDVLHEVEHTRHQLASLDEQLVPALRDMVARHERAVELGEATVFGLLEARVHLSIAEEARARALGARAWAEVRLWLLLSELERGGQP